jgi:hypothetical protein
VKLLDLGQGRYLTSPNAQVALSFGYKPTGRDFVKDIQSQIRQQKDFAFGLHKLEREGASQGLLTTLQQGGVDQYGRLVHELAVGPAGQLRQYDALFKQRIQQMVAQNVQITASRVEVKGEGAHGGKSDSSDVHYHDHWHGPTDKTTVMAAGWRRKVIAKHRR